MGIPDYIWLKFKLVKKVIVVLSFLGITLATQAQTKLWTLEECIEYARTNNIQIQQSQLNVDGASIDKNTSYYALLPNISGSAFGGYSFGQRLDQYNLTFVNQRTTSANVNLSGSLLLFGGLQNINRIKQNKYAYESSKFALEQAYLDLSLNVANAFLRLTLAKERLTIAETQIRTTELQVARTREIYEAGATNKGELLNVESQYTQEEINVVTARNELAASSLALAQLLNLDTTGIDIQSRDINIDSGPDPVLAQPVYSIYDKALGINPGIQSQDWTVRSRQSAVNVAKGAWSPSISLAGSIGSGYSSLSQEITDTSITITPGQTFVYPTYGGDTVAITTPPTVTPSFTRQTIPFFRQLPRNQNTQIGISINIPILNGLSNYTNLSRARINLTSARLELESRKQNLRNTVQGAYNDAMAGYSTYKANQKNAEALREAFVYAEERFNAGQMNAYDYNLAKNNLNNAELQTVISKYEYLYRIKILEYYLGKPMKL